MKTIDLDAIDDFSKFEIRAKLNGIFARWNPEEKKLRTKSGGAIVSVPHIVESLLKTDYAVEGELYCHGMPFQDINSLVMWGHDSKKTISFFPHHKIPKSEASSRLGFDRIYNKILNDGYEGVVLTNKKTFEQFKHKPRYDMEAVIVHFNPGTGKNKNTFGSLELETASGERFSCSGMSSRDRARLWEDQGIGKTVKVSYLSLTKRGVPVSPSFEDYRWDETITPTRGGARAGAGRKLKSEKDRRSVKKMYRWTKSEYAAIQKAAKAAGMKESDFVRRAVMGGL